VLGGPTSLGRLTGNLSGAQAVCNWIQRRRFPAAHYFVMKEALADKGFFAPLTLWGFTSAASLLRKAA
jgi:hypothetical protein